MNPRARRQRRMVRSGQPVPGCWCQECRYLARLRDPCIPRHPIGLKEVARRVAWAIRYQVGRTALPPGRHDVVVTHVERNGPGRYTVHAVNRAPIDDLVVSGTVQV